MMIVGVVANPGQAGAGDEQVISMQEAVDAGILDFSNGLYVNPLTKQSMSMVEAMNAGWIKVHDFSALDFSIY